MNWYLGMSKTISLEVELLPYFSLTKDSNGEIVEALKYPIGPKTQS